MDGSVDPTIGKSAKDSGTVSSDTASLFGTNLRNPSWRAAIRPSRDRTYDCKRSAPASQKNLAGRGPSTYVLGPAGACPWAALRADPRGRTRGPSMTG